MAIRWDATRAEYMTAIAIARRAVGMQIRGKDTVLEVAMDILATHLNGCSLDLEGLLNADHINFVHDLVKIGQHIDRDTGQLHDFTPRFAAKTFATQEEREDFDARR